MTEDTRAHHQFHERKRSLTDADIAEILTAFENRPVQPHLFCRFEKVTEEDFYASVEFFKNVNEGLKSGKILAAKTILVLLVTLLFGIIGAGIVTKFKSS